MMMAARAAAAPHVAAVAALIKSLKLQIPFELTKQQLLEPSSVDLIADFDPAGPYPIITGGRVNAFKAVNGFDPNDPNQITDLTWSGRTFTSITLEWTATGDDGAVGQASLYHLRYSLNPINESNWLLATKATGVPAPAVQGTGEYFTVGNLACGTTYYFALKAFDEWGNGPLSNVKSATTRAPLCPQSYCSGEEMRCSWEGTCGAGGCCVYECHPDPSCLGPDPCPSGACNCL